VLAAWGRYSRSPQLVLCGKLVADQKASYDVTSAAPA
ncbi:hypothetical protein Tco_1507337, partial [Tanacetum coccineum]